MEVVVFSVTEISDILLCKCVLVCAHVLVVQRGVASQELSESLFVCFLKLLPPPHHPE